MSSQTAHTRNASVSHDWRKALSSEKSRAYLSCLQTLETTYAMFSVNLDEAFGMRRRGRTEAAYELLSVAPALCRRLAVPLHSLLAAMLDHGKHFGTAPNTHALDAENFHSPRGQRAAKLSDLFSRVLLTRKSQFLLKMSTLSELVQDLDLSFERIISDLARDESEQPEQDWDALDSVHYDLNSCLRHSIVLLKSFLHALPETQLAEFEAKLQARSLAPCYTPAAARVRHLAHRRMVFLKGQ